MFFSKRRWALRITEEMDLDVYSQATTELVAMIIQGSKQFAAMTQSAKTKMKDPELILMSAATLRTNESAKQRLLQESDLNINEVDQLFESAWRTARDLAVQYEFDDLLNSSWFRQG